MSNLLDSLVSGLRIDTAWGPPIVMQDPFASGPPTATSETLSVLKPKITVTLRIGGDQVFEPYGDPGDSMWPYLINGSILALVGVLGAAALWRLKS